jgi:peptidoglycan/xylan/chitin deacetylase (PgdA/CDA1 family)
LRRECTPIALKELSHIYQQGNLPARAVAVTFDDGYFDNLANAKPLLERYDVPATVFVTTGQMERNREFWWDELDRILLQPGILPETLCLGVKGSTFRWTLRKASHYGKDSYSRHRCWNVLNNKLLGPRQRLYGSIHQLLRPLSEEVRRGLLDELAEWAGLARIVRPTHRTLSAAELVCLAEGGLLEVGAHTVTHPVLSTLPAVVQQQEIRSSKYQLENILGRPVAGFAYPYGFRKDYTAETAAIIQEAGFARACTSVSGLVWRGSDRFQLPRVIVFDCNGDEFARRLKHWFPQ